MVMLRRPVIASLLLLTIYGLLSTLLDPGGYLGTDTGAKVATLAAMDESGSASPGVGYWAEEWDPEGTYHPLLDTHRVGGEWVNVTTLPMLEAARPLYAAGGYRLALLLPMIGAIGAALAARALVMRLSTPGAGDVAFWAIGVASPMAVYALDLWEHSLGVALVVAAVAILAGRLDHRRGILLPVCAGVCFGVAGAMRTESLVYAAVAVGAASAWHLYGRRLAVAAEVSVGAAVGYLVPWVANRGLEASVGGLDRGDRIAGAAGVADGSGLAGAASARSDEFNERVSEAVRTTFDLGAVGARTFVAAGVLVAILVIVATRLTPDHGRQAQQVAGAVGVVYALRLLAGPSFTSGFIAALPLAAAALGLRWQRTTLEMRYVLVVSLGSLPVVWAFQFIGGAGPQWGGRYVLPTAVLLACVGVAGLVASGHRQVLALLLVPCVAITGLGVAWASERTHAVADVFEQLAVAPDDVIIVPNGFFVREGGAAALERRFLSVGRGGTLDGAVEVAEAAALDGFAILDVGGRPPEPPAGATEIGSRRIEYIGFDLMLWSYRF